MPIEIVAEIAAAHNGSLDRALATIEAAKDAGADAVKFQTWKPGTMAYGRRKLQTGPWAGRTLEDLYEEAHTPWEWHQALIAKAQACGLQWWSTPFDLESLAFLESFGCPRYKIASFELVDLPLINAVAATRKPVILSVGMATEREIIAATDLCSLYQPTLLWCVSSYPAKSGDMAMETMPYISNDGMYAVGLSDHTRGTVAPVMAVALGASMIERHITLGGDGPDDGFASTPDEFRAMVKAVREAESAMGIKLGPKPGESTWLRRSLWVVAPVKAGMPIPADSIRTARPAEGMDCKYLPHVIGRIASRDVEPGTPLTEDCLV